MRVTKRLAQRHFRADHARMPEPVAALLVMFGGLLVLAAPPIFLPSDPLSAAFWALTGGWWVAIGAADLIPSAHRTALVAVQVLNLLLPVAVAVLLALLVFG